MAIMGIRCLLPSQYPEGGDGAVGRAASGICILSSAVDSIVRCAVGSAVSAEFAVDQQVVPGDQRSAAPDAKVAGSFGGKEPGAN